MEEITVLVIRRQSEGAQSQGSGTEVLRNAERDTERKKRNEKEWKHGGKQREGRRKH